MTATANQGRYVSVALVILAAFFATSLVTANIVAVKLLEFGPLVVPAGTIMIFPLTYVIANITTEVYGYSRTRQIIWLGFLCNLLAGGVIYLTQVLPPADFWDGQEAYERILGFVPRLLLASLIAYLAGEFVNAFVLAKMKIFTRGRYLWTRTIGSSTLGQGIDSLIFVTIAFAGVIASDDLLRTIVASWILKSAYEVLATPMTYALANYLKRTEALDTFDRDTDFSPFRL
jgi:queuosine precursor transporter